jgi:hypothetical protein
MAKRIDPATKLVDACLDLAEERGWAAVMPARAAERAGLSLADTYDIARDRAAILRLISRSIDRAVLQRIDVDAEDPVRDRLFDVLMTRFDVLNERRFAYLAILQGLPASPVSALCSIPRLETSMRWMLNAADIQATGIAGDATVRGLTLVWLAVLRVWAQDESPDMAKTMAALDQRLVQAEQWANTVTPRLAFLDRLMSRATHPRPRSEGNAGEAETVSSVETARDNENMNDGPGTVGKP